MVVQRRALVVLRAERHALFAAARWDGTTSPLLFYLGTMKVRKLDAREWELNPAPEFCPYEVDLSHMLFVMKYSDFFSFLYHFLINAVVCP